ncbi:MAG: ATP-binding protein [Pseudomonadota bacterium]
MIPNQASSRLASFPEQRRGLRVFLLYRFFLAVLLLAAPLSRFAPVFLGHSFPRLYLMTAAVYLSMICLSAGLLIFCHRPMEYQVQFALFIDILAITLLMHGSGGVGRGLGLLLAISVAIGCMLLGGRATLIFAALAALAMLTEQIYADLADQFPTTAYTQTGMLGGAYFAIAWLAHFLGRRLSASEGLALQRGIDLANLAQLNDYIVRHLDQGLLVIDGSRRIRLLNDTARTLLTLPQSAMGGSLALFAPALARVLAQSSRVILAGTREPLLFQTLPERDPLLATCTPLGHQGQDGLLIFLEDSAWVARRVQQLKLAALGRLSAAIAHQIRNPLAAIHTAGQLLAESLALSSEDHRLADLVVSNSNRLNETVDAVLQLSRREPQRPQPIILDGWLRECLEDLRIGRHLTPERLELGLETPDPRVCADERLLRQILLNLIDNALIHGQKSPVRVVVGKTAAGDLFIEVCDRGPGIDPQTARQIFEPFFTTRTNGTGLGLYIARELAEIHHLILEYRPNGPETCFRLTFPGSPENEPPA